MTEVRDGVGGPWRAKVAGTMGSSTVVMANIFGEYDKQVSLAEDQHAVGEFGPQGAHVRRSSSPAGTGEESGPPGCPH